MKKIITAILALIAIPTIAQISGDGYYRIQNNGSERYITITDNVLTNISTSSTIIDYGNITTWFWDNIKSNPASIIYIKAVGSEYDISAQGISVHNITGGKAYVQLNQRGSDKSIYHHHLQPSHYTNLPIFLWEKRLCRPKRGYIPLWPDLP